MQTVADILSKFNPVEDKYVSREFQTYGLHIAEELNDMSHKGLYMKLAKTVPRPLLEKAMSFVKDANVKKKGALFMWKLKALGAWPAGDDKTKKKKKKDTDIPF